MISAGWSLSIFRHHNKLRDASVEGFGGSIGFFPKLLVVTGLQKKVLQLLSEEGICKGTGLWVHISLCKGCDAPASPRPEKSPPQTDQNTLKKKEQKSLLNFTFSIKIPRGKSQHL